jgi:hypothetical protein
VVGTLKRAPPFLEQRKEEKRAKKKNGVKEAGKRKKRVKPRSGGPIGPGGSKKPPKTSKNAAQHSPRRLLRYFICRYL